MISTNIHYVNQIHLQHQVIPSAFNGPVKLLSLRIETDKGPTEITLFLKDQVEIIHEQKDGSANRWLLK